MKSGERTFGRNEVIYNEGDISDAVYVVVSGRVELFKASDDGPVLVGSCGPMEMFGETGILEDAPRESGARAIQKTRVKCVSRDEFMVWMEHEPNAALRAMGLLAERLRTADTIIARSQGGERVTLVGARPSLLTLLKELIRRPRGGSRAAAARAGGGPAVAPPFVIGVSTVNNDIESGWTRALIALLDGRSGITVREIAEPLQIETNPDQAQAGAAMLRARQVLGHEDKLDLLVWGDVHSEGYSLWFTPAGAVDDDRPGSFSLYLRLELPGDQEPPAGELLYVTVLAAIEPLNEGQRNLQRQLLGAAYQALPAMPNDLPVSWSLEQQRTALTCCGHAAATLAAMMDGEPGWYDHAVEVYNAAINRLPRGEGGMDEALLRKHLAGVLQAASDRRQNADLLEQAVGEYRSAAECLVKAVHPQEWASSQNRLGQALYKLDLMTGQSALLKEAMGAFQAALQVYTRAEAPYRWAEVMNNLAQVLQVYGDLMKSPEVLERAVDACRAALEFRSRGRTPLPWAACQNTLATALFLLDKHRQSTEHLDEAGAAYTAALEVFRLMGATRLAAVAEKNLAHVQRLNQIRSERRVALPDWSDESGKSLPS